MAAALGVHTLANGNVAFGALPPTVADTRPLLILTITTAQYRAGSWREREGGEGRERERGGRESGGEGGREGRGEEREGDRGGER